MGIGKNFFTEKEEDQEVVESLSLEVALGDMV